MLKTRDVKPGMSFGKWTTTGFHESGKVPCVCDCGFSKKVDSYQLRKGDSLGCNKCGAKKRGELFKKDKTPKRLYSSWLKMNGRCRDKSNKWYGGRGISVCNEWSSFANFKKWAMSSGWREDLFIDRKENEEGYCPENCQWVTHAKNCQNRRSTRLNQEIVSDVREMLNKGVIVAEIARKFKVHHSTIDAIKRGWSWNDNQIQGLVSDSVRPKRNGP